MEKPAADPIVAGFLMKTGFRLHFACTWGDMIGSKLMLKGGVYR